MGDDVLFEEPRETVMELVLSSDEEFQGDGFRAEARAEHRRAWWRDAGNRFLPGVDAGAVFALAVGLLALISSAFVEIWATNQEVVDNWNSEAVQASPKGPVDPLAAFRHLTELRSTAQGVFAVVAVLLALLVLSRWDGSRHARWSRPVAQAALCLGLAGIVMAVLLRTGVVGGIPSPEHLRLNRPSIDG